MASRKDQSIVDVSKEVESILEVLPPTDLVIVNGTTRLPKYLLNWADTLVALHEPFEPEDVYFLPQTINYDKKTATAAAYANSRVYTERMNLAIGLGFWQSEVVRVEIAPFTKVVKEKIDWKTKEVTTPGTSLSAHKAGVVVRVGIYMGPVLGWVWQDSTGGKDTADENWLTTAEAQAYKRAMCKWGPGEYFYKFGKQSCGYNTKTASWTEQPIIPEHGYPNHNCKDCGVVIEHFTWVDKDNITQSKHFWDIVVSTRNLYGRQLCVPCAKTERNAQTTAEAKDRLLQSPEVTA